MLTLIVGTSGSGKTTFAHTYFGKDNAIVTVTTRAKRHEELEGVDYYFIDDVTYDELKRNDQFIECTTYAGNRYGVLKGEFKRHQGKPRFYANVDIYGYQKLSQYALEQGIPYEVLYFTIDAQTVEERLKLRGDEPKDIERRLVQIRVDNANNLPLLGDSHVIVIDASQSLNNMYAQYFDGRRLHATRDHTILAQTRY